MWNLCVISSFSLFPTDPSSDSEHSACLFLSMYNTSLASQTRLHIITHNIFCAHNLVLNIVQYNDYIAHIGEGVIIQFETDNVAIYTLQRGRIKRETSLRSG